MSKLLKLDPTEKLARIKSASKNLLINDRQKRVKVEKLLQEAHELLQSSHESDALLAWMVEDCLDLLRTQTFKPAERIQTKATTSSTTRSNTGLGDARLKLQSAEDSVGVFVRKNN